MDPADAGERVEGLAAAVALGRLDPLGGPAIVGEVPTGPDHAARRDAAGERRELAADGRERSLLEEADTRHRVARRDLERAQVGPGPGLQIGVDASLADRDRTLGERERLVEVTGRGSALAGGECEIPVDVAVTVRADESLRASQPARCLGRPSLPEVVARDAHREVGGPFVVAVGLPLPERPFEESRPAARGVRRRTR